MEDTGNLPQWDGAAGAYSRAYRILANMGRRGHATPARISKAGKVITQGSISDDMRSFVDALNNGDEERIKANILANLNYL